MDRRTCIKAALIASCVAAATGFAASSATSGRGGIRSRLGLQLFLVRSLLQKDVRGTLRKLAAIGFTELEMFGFGGSTFSPDPFFGLKLQEFQSLIRNLRLTVPTIHFSDGAGDRRTFAETALELGAHHLILAMPSEFLTRTDKGLIVSGLKDLEHAKRLAKHLNELGTELRQYGVGFAYHNHHMEFARFGDVCAYDVLLAETDPDLVKLELDVGWATVAGVDPASYLERSPGRYISCHLKDFNPKLALGTDIAVTPIPAQAQLVPPGDGIIDFKKLLAVMDRTGVRHGFIEVDSPKGDPLDEAGRGFRYLTKLPASA